MGFPVGYSELLLPKLLLQLVFILGSVRRLISWAFDIVGLGDLLDPDAPWPRGGDQQALSAAAASSPHVHSPEFHSVSALLLQEILPVVRFEDLPAHHRDAVESCAVCLYEFEGPEEVRRLSNCRHVFHQCCLDRWMDHDQRTCPLCRTPLIPEEMQEAFNDRFWASAGIPDSNAIEYSSTFPSSSPLIAANSLLLT